MELKYRLELADYIEYINHQRTLTTRPQAPYYWWLILPGLVAAITILTRCNLLLSFGIVTMYVLATSIHQVRYNKTVYAQHYSAEKFEGWLGDRTIKLTPAAFIETTDRCDLIYRWKPYYRVTSTTNFVLLHVSQLQAFIIPKRIFVSEEECTAFIDEAKKLIAGSQPPSKNS